MEGILILVVVLRRHQMRNTVPDFKALGATRAAKSDRHGPVRTLQRESEPRSEHDRPKEGLTCPKRESTVLVRPYRFGTALLPLCFLPSRFARPPWCVPNRRYQMKMFVRSLWDNQEGQDIAEYAVMLAVILVIVVGTIRLIGSNANNVFSSVGSAIK